MSSSTWTADALSSSAKAYASQCWRIVEAQHQVSTMKVTDTSEEQDVLEQIIEDTKPPIPTGCERLDFLLVTPFRYSVINPNGSRFRRPNAPHGVFYASEHALTAVAEMAFYRLLFYAESPATPYPQNPGEYSGFAVEIASDRTLDLTELPFANEDQLNHLRDYSQSQGFADQAREARIEVIRYRSLRDPEHRSNLAVLSPAAFAKPEPVGRQSWKLYVDANGIRAVCESPRVSIAFGRTSFNADSRLNDFRWVR
ncbi:hypothetical protein BSZ21_38935 [Bradyrhizobium canariense]|uniref:RES family NAD+ phosphorylase n=1 Tax=Bradyrhizobium canariense TaxID=255045 RepID=UPI000A18A5FB|nr:RES family NAD+ phosphorylase [Bradyrhizobium canariense]OSI60338.1 hypothetical protein BSZ21_38935 [Bradyrhizobium canariense]